MKLAASQIGWAQEELEPALDILRQSGFCGVEIAPTMVAGPQPYQNIEAGVRFAEMAGRHGLSVCSMQSLWYGQTGSVFGPERPALLEYTRQAVLFAAAVGAGNMVFGSPKNRNMPAGTDEAPVLEFFKQIGDFAAQNGTVFALEANPAVYGTNYMNTTPQALDTAARVGSPGCKVNLDVGTMVLNGEEAEALRGHVGQINHVHISEPQLAMIQPRTLHGQLAALLRQEGYAGFISIEMKQQPLENLQKAAAYVAEVFG